MTGLKTLSIVSSLAFWGLGDCSNTKASDNACSTECGFLD